MGFFMAQTMTEPTTALTPIAMTGGITISTLQVLGMQINEWALLLTVLLLILGISEKIGLLQLVKRVISKVFKWALLKF